MVVHIRAEFVDPAVLAAYATRAPVAIFVDWASQPGGAGAEVIPRVFVGVTRLLVQVARQLAHGELFL
eukprot:4219967-Pyramimonas_sp.AAC.1